MEEIKGETGGEVGGGGGLVVVVVVVVEVEARSSVGVEEIGFMVCLSFANSSPNFVNSCSSSS